MIQVHPKPQSFTCNDCKIIFPNKTMLDQHILNHQKYTCTTCHKVINSKELLTGHTNITHKNEIHECFQCNHKEKTDAELAKHIDEKNFSHTVYCSKCGKRNDNEI